MNSYLISKTEGTPDWSKVPVLPVDQVMWLEDCGIRARAQIAYDKEALYVRLSAVEEHIRAEHRGRPHQIADDSCLEFFFCPIWEDKRYFNIEFNLNGALYLGFGSGLHDLVRLLVQDEEATFWPRPFHTDDGWGIEYRIPYDFVCGFMPEFHPESGAYMRANCYKCGDKTVKPHYLAWNPLTSETPAFHRPQDFGCMVFE